MLNKRWGKTRKEMTDTKNIKPRVHVITKLPIGEVGIVYRERPFLLLNVFLPSTDGKNLMDPVTGQKWKLGGSHPKIREISGVIEDYFRGKPIAFHWDDLCMDGLTVLQQAVLKATIEIPFGALTSYKKIAVAIGRPDACRFVGSALAKNPFPILIPCHRVIRSDASIGQFGGGAALKRKLIELETRYAAAAFGKTGIAG